MLASRLLGDAALAAGLSPMVSETHGMAQRGGIVVSTVVLGALTSPLISAGEADIMLGFEALETFRAMDRCRPDALVLANRAAIAPYPVSIGQARYPEVQRMFEVMAPKVGALLAMDANELARQAGSPLGVNMVVLGALAGAGRLPLDVELLLEAIRTGTKAKFLEANLRAFEQGRNAAQTPQNWLKPLGAG